MSRPASITHTKEIVVLVVGEVPPPVTGQALMIQQFLRREYEGLRLVHVPLEFSRTTAEIGAFGLRKLALLLNTLLNILMARFRTGATVLYYPPAGPNLNPFLRDVALLLPTRWLFRQTIFHFHAAGLCNLYPSLSPTLQRLFRSAYSAPDLAIFTTQATAEGTEILEAKQQSIVPCGIPDHALPRRSWNTPAAVPVLLYAGILCEGKGVMVLLEACRLLHEHGEPFHLVCMGAFQSPDFQTAVESFIQTHNLQFHVTFPGVLTGSAKAKSFAHADIFCFPSHYSCESFGVVLIEAMSYELPIVSTQWQGIPEVTGKRGALLVPVKDHEALFQAILLLLRAPDLRQRMGTENRARYLDHFTDDVYCRHLSTALRTTAASAVQAVHL